MKNIITKLVKNGNTRMMVKKERMMVNDVCKYTRYQQYMHYNDRFKNFARFIIISFLSRVLNFVPDFNDLTVIFLILSRSKA